MKKEGIMKVSSQIAKGMILNTKHSIEQPKKGKCSYTRKKKHKKARNHDI